MDSEKYIIFNDIFYNWNSKPCSHYYNNFIMPLLLSCKTLNKIYQNFSYDKTKCDICYFREIMCDYCREANKIQFSCKKCICQTCGISANLTGHFPLIEGVCCECYEIRGPTGLTGETGPPGCYCCRNRHMETKPIKLHKIRNQLSKKTISNHNFKHSMKNTNRRRK